MTRKPARTLCNDREIFHRPNGKRCKLTCDADLHRLLEIV
jgi:hypothetical protein